MRSAGDGIPPLPGAPSISRKQTLLVSIAGLLYAISMHKFLIRDPLSTGAGMQGVIELSGMFGAFVCICVATWNSARSYAASLTAICFAVFSLFAIASSWRSWNPPLSLAKGLTLASVFAAGYLTNQAGMGRQYIRAVYWAYTGLLVLGLVVGVLLPHQYPLFTIDEFSGRTRLSVFSTFAGVMGEIVGLFLLLAPLLGKRIGWVSQVFLFAMLVLAGGKTSTALVCLLLMLRFLSTLRRWNSWQAVSIIIGVACLGAFGALSLLNTGGHSHGVERAAQSIYGTRVSNEAVGMDGRLDLWIAAVKLLGNAQALGYGIDGTRDIMLKVADWSGGSHSGYLELALSAGVLGFAFFAWGLGRIIVAAFRAKSALRVNSLLILIYILVNAAIGGIFNGSSYFGLLTLLWMSYELQPHQEIFRVSRAPAVPRRQRHLMDALRAEVRAMPRPRSLE